MFYICWLGGWGGEGHVLGRQYKESKEYFDVISSHPLLAILYMLDSQ